MSPAEGARRLNSRALRVDIRDEASLCVLMLTVPRLAVPCPSCEWYGSSSPSLFSCVYGPARLQLRAAGTWRCLIARRPSAAEVGCGSNCALISCHCQCPAAPKWFWGGLKCLICSEEFTEPRNAPLAGGRASDTIVELFETSPQHSSWIGKYFLR